jgi:haloacetate dehalogenase
MWHLIAPRLTEEFTVIANDLRLAADPEKTLFRGGSEASAPEAMEEYVRCLRDPETIHATCEYYRATVDFAHDAEDHEAGA